MVNWVSPAAAKLIIEKPATSTAHIVARNVNSMVASLLLRIRQPLTSNVCSSPNSRHFGRQVRFLADLVRFTPKSGPIAGPSVESEFDPKETMVLSFVGLDASWIVAVEDCQTNLP
jgi:hypothetical protein